MSMTGTFEEAIGKAYDLYMEHRMSDETVARYFSLMRAPDIGLIFSEKDVEKLMAMLTKDKGEYEDETIEIEEEIIQ